MEGGPLLSSPVIIIPARYQSGRLPGKPLVQLAGVPMIERTWRQCTKGFDAARVYIATDDERIASHCRSAGAQVIMTSDTCLTGTDRVAEAALQLDADVIINVQGDEPLFNPDDIGKVLAALERHPGEILNGYADITSEEEFRSPSMPKAVVREDEQLLYMSRGAVPTSKKREFHFAWRQVCIYAFPRTALAAFTAHGRKTPLEAIEDIEILRFLELGWPVRMVRVSSDSIPVDNPEDVARVEAVIAARPADFS